MVFRDASKFDHDRNGRAGGSTKKMTKTNEPADKGNTVDLVSRDERHDSVDPQTGTLTEEAVALRAEKNTQE